MTTTSTKPAAPSARTGAVRSMTGFAQARVEVKGWNLRLTIRSVNHRFLDLHFRFPEGFEALESRIRQAIREHVRRGHLDLSLDLEPAGSPAVAVNLEVAAAYLEAAESLRRQFGVQAEPDLAAILRLPGVIAAPIKSIEEDFEVLAELLTQCLTEALERLNHMREVEGQHLKEELHTRLQNILARCQRIEELAEQSRPAFARRLELRLRELLGDSALDPGRLAQEAAIAAERSDVSEELARVRSHVIQFESLLSSGLEIGKRLDFLLQEMQREANTLLSKTPGNDAGGIEITGLALEVKSEIEKLREQVQNIE